MWRDRTNLYISYRQSYSHHPAKKSRYAGAFSNGYSDNAALPEEERGLMASEPFNDNDAVIEMDVLPPRWLDIQDEVSDLLESIAKKTTQLDSLHAKHVLPGFDDEAVKKREEREIEKMTQEITRSFQSCQQAIRKVEAMSKGAKARGDAGQAEEIMARNLQISLATKVGDASAAFRKKQTNYLKKLRSLSGMASLGDSYSTSSQANPYADPSLMESDADRSLGQSTLQQAQSQKRRATGNDTIIAQREKEIEDIAQGIIELANIFQELQTMVIDQGTMLDRIDYNVERMGADVKEADKELNVATGYQKKSTKRRIILLLVLLIAGVIILLLLKPKGGSEPPSPPSPPPEAIAAPPPARRRRQPP